MGLSSGDQMSLMKKPMSCGTVLCDFDFYGFPNSALVPELDRGDEFWFPSS